MSVYRIGDGDLSAGISDVGGEPVSLSTADGREILWQADPLYWDGHAPNLFPVCGRTTGLEYEYRGKKYPMPAHGFLKDSLMRPVVLRPDEVVLEFIPGEKEQKIYPFDYSVRCGWRIFGTSLEYRIEVENRGDETMYFAWGGHPGFTLPLCEGLDFEDYSIVFDEPCAPLRLEITPDGYLGEGRTPLELKDGRRLPLKRSYFEIDGVFMSGACRSLKLCAKKGPSVGMSFPDCPTLGLWTACGGAAPFICIEPWSGTPDRQGVPCVLEKKPDMTALAPGGRYTGSYTITVSEE